MANKITLYRFCLGFRVIYIKISITHVYIEHSLNNFDERYRLVSPWPEEN